MIELHDVAVEFVRRNRLGRSVGKQRALDGVNLRVQQGARFGVTGRSGSGKSTLARCLAGWLKPTEGRVDVDGEVQLVMQDAGGSLNPRFTAAEAIEEPLRIRGSSAYPAGKIFAQMGLDVSRADQKTGTFSGGQRARIAVGRALAAFVAPARSLLILDESLAALDDETRERILAVVDEWNRVRGLALMFVSHEPELLAACAVEAIRIEAGRMV